MKKLLGILVLGLLWCNILSAKILNIENKISLDVPKSHIYIKYKQTDETMEFFETLEDYEAELFLVGPSKYVDLEKSILDGEDIMENKYVQSIMKKMQKKNFRDEVQAGKWMISEAKKIMKKEKIDFITYAVVSNKNLAEISSEDDEILSMINELQNMNNSEISQKTKEIRKELTSLSGNNKSIPINENMTINLNKFKIAKNEYEKLFLKSSGKLIYIMDALKIDAFLNVFLSEHNNKTYLFLSACYVNCSKFNTKFDKMTKPMFSTTSKIVDTGNNATTSNDSNIVDQIQQLNELYKSGALTKEEFEKAKKKLLN